MTTQLSELLEMAAALDALASDSGTAERTLATLAAAFFADGNPGIEKLTWTDEDANQGPGEPHTAEDRLRAAEARFRTLVEQIPAVTFMAVLGQGKNEIYVSPHIEQMLGFTQAEWLADPFLWYWQLHHHDRKAWNDEFARGCHAGGPFRAECRFHARDGRVVWVHGEARLVKDDLGRPLFLQGVAFDITESKRAQELVLHETARVARMEEELAIAQRVQTMILPRNFNVAGLEISAVMVPASEIGGDYYDVLPVAGGAWLAVGDVAGHGLDAGLIMLLLQSAVASVTRARPEATPREVWALVNETLVDAIRTRFGRDEHVTFSLMRYTSSGDIVMAGGHEDILVCRKATGKVELVRSPGPWLGARRDAAVRSDATMRLEDGDLMVLYTDGITEAMNAAGEQFHVARLSGAVEEVRDEPTGRVAAHVLEAVRAWMQEQSDDMSVVAVRYRAPAG